MSLNREIKDFLQQDALERFLRYVKVHTTSEDDVEKTPTSDRQFDLAKTLKAELEELGLKDVTLDEHCYTYATLPSNIDREAQPVGFIAHVDTSGAVSGENVVPRIIENYDGSEITFPDDRELKITHEDAPELKDLTGENIITASGKTLLGADDKAGIAEIMAAMAAFVKFPQLKHGEVKICFTPDEEVGMGTAKIDLKRLPEYCYTVDGSVPGELEFECFDAYLASFTFKGINVHPGFAKDRMVNALNIAARYLTELPEWESPEHTEKREGFYHPMDFRGTPESTSFKMIIRDFINANNLKRIEFLKKLNAAYEAKYPGLKIEMETKHQYENMVEALNKHPRSLELARNAITEAGLEVISTAIRGGTDGARLSQMGHPTPNLFAGGMLFHSRKEFIAESSLGKAAEVVVNLAMQYAGEGK